MGYLAAAELREAEAVAASWRGLIFRACKADSPSRLVAAHLTIERAIEARANADEWETRAEDLRARLRRSNVL